MRFNELGGPEVLRLEDLDAGRPGPGEVRIRVDAIRVFPLEQIVEAHRYLESNAQFGKIVVTVRSSEPR